MNLLPEQCRAGRSLLNWSQDELAKNAQVGRATIADFENFETVGRSIGPNALASIRSALEAAGVMFLDVEGDLGAGVRLRRSELEYSKRFRIAPEGIVLALLYRGKRYKALIAESIIEDLNRTSYAHPDQWVKGVQDKLPVILVAANRALKNEKIREGSFILERRWFDPNVW